MKKTTRNIVEWIIRILSLCALVPTLGMYGVGALIVLIASLRGPGDFAMSAGFFAVAGYSLFSLLWLIFKFGSVSLWGIPWRIRIGLIIGALIAAPFFFRAVFSVSLEALFSWLEPFFMFGGGALLSLIVILVYMTVRDEKGT